MAYEPTNWKDMDIITAEKLNKMETQLTPLIVTVTKIQPDPDDDSQYFYGIDLSYKDIYDAFFVGRNVILCYPYYESVDGWESSLVNIIRIRSFNIEKYNGKTLYTIYVDFHEFGSLQSTSETEPMTSEERGSEYFEDPTQQ